MDVLKEAKVEDTLVSVTNWAGHKNLGRVKFDLVVKTSKDVLNINQ